MRRQLAAAAERAADLEDELADVRDWVKRLKHQASVDESLRNSLLTRIADLERERDQLYGQCDALRRQIRTSREAFIDLQEEHIELAVRIGNLNFEWAHSEELHKDRALTSLRDERERVQRLEVQIAEANRIPKAD